MTKSLFILPALVALTFTSEAHSKMQDQQQAQNQPEISQDIKAEADAAAKKAEKAAKKLEPAETTPAPATSTSVSPTPASSTSTSPSPAPASSTSTAAPAPASSASTAAPTPTSSTLSPASASTVSTTPKHPLEEQFKEKQESNFKTLEFDFAKQKALQRVSDKLSSEAESLFKEATTQLTAFLGSLSQPEVQGNYFFNNEDLEKGTFDIAFVRESYVKSKKNDVCLVSTKVQVSTSIDSELIPPTAVTSTETPTDETLSAEQAPINPLTSYTEVKCFSNSSPTYYQQIVR